MMCVGQQVRCPQDAVIFRVELKKNPKNEEVRQKIDGHAYRFL